MNTKLTHRQCEAKCDLIYILDIAGHNVCNGDEVLHNLSPQYQKIAKKLDSLWDSFDKDTAIELQMLNYLNNYIFKRESDMKNMIKAFISYNSNYPNYFGIPSDKFIENTFK